MDYLTALKYHPYTFSSDNGSYRFVSEANPAWQYHIHTFDVDDGVDVFGHLELRPDMRPISSESWGDMVDRLRTHYKPTRGTYRGRDGDYYITPCAPDVVVDKIDSVGTVAHSPNGPVRADPPEPSG